MGFFHVLGSILRFIRSVLLNLLLLVFVVILISVIVNAPKPHIPNNEALYIAPQGLLVDELSYQPSALDLLNPQMQDPETLVRDIVKSIHDAKTDKRITGIVLNLNDLLGGGISKLTEIGEALDNFRESGKKVVAYSDFYNQQQYYLANFADEVYVHEMGGILLTGYGMYRNYFKDATEKLALRFHVFRAGEFKDAIEPYIESEMSEASREHNTRWLNELWEQYTDKVENARNLPAGAVDEFILEMPGAFKKFGGSHAKFAESAGLVDAAITRQDLRAKLIEHFGKNQDGDSFAAIDMQDYLAVTEVNPFDAGKNNIGLIIATGTIMEGRQPAGSIGGDSLAELIRQAREDEELKALVIRVDSGGGSAFASEIIRQELLETKEKSLPIYISMGSVAASGGYWIATPADEIWATPTTITGSIGVWGLFPDYSESFSKIGINTDGVATTPLAGAFRGDLPMKPEVKTLLQASVDNIYTTFLSITSEAREMEVEAVHEIAQGRVWTGATAKELGLVDNLGSLDDVIAAAAANLNLTDYQVKPIVRPLSTKEQIIRSLMQAAHNVGVAVRASFIEGVIGVDLNEQGMTQLSQALSNNFSAFSLPRGSHNEIVAQCLVCLAP